MVIRSNACNAGQGGVPVCNGDDSVKLLTPPVIRHVATGHKGVRANPSFPITVLAPLQRPVVGGGRLIYWTTVVGGENDEGVGIHALLLQSSDKPAHHGVHVQSHCCIKPAVFGPRNCLIDTTLLNDTIDLRDVCLRDLERRVKKVEGIEQEQRLPPVMFPDDFKCILVEHGFLITIIRQAVVGMLDVAARGVHLRGNARLLHMPNAFVAAQFGSYRFVDTAFERLVVQRKIPELVQANVHIAGRLKRQALLPVVIRMLEIPQEGIIAFSKWGVIRRRHANVPLPNEMSLVATVLHLLRDACHVHRDTCIPRHVILRVPVCHTGVHRVHVHRQAPTLQRGPRG
mmetsp:Transcript_5926/g.10730  ORF Transcript_5926/g.10730 Transcript_5926/m.10730 type:complete len:343 (+) Transcript_5926:1033-2061(+)